MNEKKKFKCKEWSSTMGEMKKGAGKYIEAMAKVLKQINAEEMESVAKEMVMMGYAVGVVAGKLSDCGIEGFTLLLEGMKISMDGEDRKEKMTYAVWDKEGDLHTSEEGYRKKKGGQS